jgi:hypothetical protein
MATKIWMIVDNITDNIATGMDIISGSQSSIKLPVEGAMNASALGHEHSLLKKAMTGGAMAKGAEFIMFCPNSPSLNPSGVLIGESDYLTVLSQPESAQSKDKQTQVLDGVWRTMYFGRPVNTESNNRLITPPNPVQAETELKQLSEATVHGANLARSPLGVVFRYYAVHSADLLKPDQNFFHKFTDVVTTNFNKVIDNGVDGFGAGVAIRLLDPTKGVMAYREIQVNKVEPGTSVADFVSKNRAVIATFYNAARDNDLNVEVIPTMSLSMGNESCKTHARRLLTRPELMSTAIQAILPGRETLNASSGQPFIPGASTLPWVSGMAAQIQIKKAPKGKNPYAFGTASLETFTKVHSVGVMPTCQTNSVKAAIYSPRTRFLAAKLNAKHLDQSSRPTPSSITNGQQTPQFKRNSDNVVDIRSQSTAQTSTQQSTPNHPQTRNDTENDNQPLVLAADPGSTDPGLTNEDIESWAHDSTKHTEATPPVQDQKTVSSASKNRMDGLLNRYRKGIDRNPTDSNSLIR